MGKNLAQTPLTAVIFAAVWCFLLPFFPSSESYSGAVSVFIMPNVGYIFMMAYGLFISIILAFIFSNARGKGIGLTMVAAVPLLFTQWVTPYARQVAFGETTGVMTRTDLLMMLARGAAATVFLLVLALLLFKSPHNSDAPRPPGAPQKKPDKYRVKKRNFVISLIVLPVIYMVVFFLTWYFLLLMNQSAREYYGISQDTNTFFKYLVYIMLNDSRQIPMALIKGLLYVLPLIPLLFQLAHKRALYILTTILLLLGPAMQMLIPSAVMPDAVRFAHLSEMSAAAVVFGGLAGFMMHMCMYKEHSKEPPIGQGAARQAATRGAGATDKAGATPPAPDKA